MVSVLRYVGAKGVVLRPWNMWRLYLPQKPALSVASLDCEYPEISTRFKASHVKKMCWWIAHQIAGAQIAAVC